jgi:signal transduction histidine kinase
MGALDWLRPPRHLLALFACVTLVPAAALVWLGWEFFERDRVFEARRIGTRLEASADRVASGIAAQLQATARALPDWIANPPATLKSDAVLVRIGSKGVASKAGGPLLFVPDPMTALIDQQVAPSDQTRWTDAEALEYRERNFEKAADAFKTIARSDDSSTRAAALVATARNLRTLGRREEALEVYRALALNSTLITGEPAELVARQAECTLLAELGRRVELSRRAQELANDLGRARWAIDHATFDMHAAKLRGWTNITIKDEDIALASALESFWQRRREQPDSAASGRHIFETGNHRALVLWRAIGDDVIALVAGKEYIERAWASTLSSQDARTSFQDTGQYTVRLRAADIGLPWDLFVSDTSAASDAASATTRRRLLGWSLAALVILIPAGGYVVWRAVQKELAVARLQSDFVSAVSHEFRTPLTSMAHLTERLQRDEAIPDDRKRQYYDVLARDTDRLRRFVETLLDFGRMEAGAATVRAKDDDLLAAVTEIVTEFRAGNSAAGRGIHIQAEAALPSVKIDREAFGRALWNLLDNASKYSPAGSPITVAIRRESDFACVAVSDLGSGIPASEHRQIFQKFVRGEESKAAGIKGTGVGLALVDRIIRAHGGEVRLQSVVGQGSTFSLVLPIAGATQ